jgi:hypothetical protein
MENEDPIVVVAVYMPQSLRDAVTVKANRAGMKLATYLRTLAIDATGWTPEDGK